MGVEGLLALEEENTEEALPGHLSPSLPAWEEGGAVSTAQRDMVACVGAASPTYLKITHRGSLPLSPQNPSYMLKVFVFNEMVVPLSTL